jgi:cytochrome d ubiquinol oxidase subunit I
MSNLLAARIQMAVSLYFHILFAAAGIALPLLMVAAEWYWLRRRDEAALALAKRWSKGTTVLFAVGAVSGTVLSFELGLLWPGFMAYAGPIIGMPFCLEGFAFFLEAIFLGIYIYGWEAVPALAHWLSGVGILVSGTISGIFVVCANAWMNAPTGFVIEQGQAVDVRPFEDRKSTRLNSSHNPASRMPSSA